MMYQKIAIDYLNPAPGCRTVTIERGKKIKIRRIPNRSLQIIHNFFIAWMKKLKLEYVYATGWEKGSSPKKNILRHVNRKGYLRTYIYKTDIIEAYRNVDVVTLAKILYSIVDKEYGYPEIRFRLYLLLYFFSRTEKKEKVPQVIMDDQLELFAELSEKDEELDDFWYTHDGLAEGYASSPMLFNLYADWVLDYPIGEFCKSQFITYTRFGDDLIFSSDKPIGRRCRGTLLQYIRNAGFDVNEQKTRYFDMTLERFHQGILLNGLLVRNGFEGVEITTPRDFRKKLEGLLHRALRDKNVNAHVIAGLFGHMRTNFIKFAPRKGEKKIFNLMRRFQRMREKEECIQGTFYYTAREKQKDGLVSRMKNHKTRLA